MCRWMNSRPFYSKCLIYQAKKKCLTRIKHLQAHLATKKFGINVIFLSTWVFQTANTANFLLLWRFSTRPTTIARFQTLAEGSHPSSEAYRHKKTHSN